jgi:hypothetical protein
MFSITENLIEHKNIIKKDFEINSPLEGWQPKADGVDRFLNIF